MQPKQETRKWDILSTGLFVEQEKGLQKTNTVPIGPSRGYLVQKEGSRKLRHDGVATCYEKQGKPQPKDGRRRKTTVLRPTVAKITRQHQAGEKKKQKSET